jgi:glutaredoxin
MVPKPILFTQPGCFSCELIKVYLEAREIAFVERDISADAAARSEMVDDLGSSTTPTLLVLSSEEPQVVVGFDPVRLDQLLSADTPSTDTPASDVPSSDAVIKS